MLKIVRIFNRIPNQSVTNPYHKQICYDDVIIGIYDHNCLYFKQRMYLKSISQLSTYPVA